MVRVSILYDQFSACTCCVVYVTIQRNMLATYFTYIYHQLNQAKRIVCYVPALHLMLSKIHQNFVTFKLRPGQIHVKDLAKILAHQS